MNLDSLMDTLTNVVGILLIILIFTVLSGADAVKRIKNFVDEISAGQLQKTQAESAELRKLLEQYRDQLAALEAATPDASTNIDKAKQTAEQLRAELEKLAKSQIDPAASRRKLPSGKNGSKNSRGNCSNSKSRSPA